MEDHVNRIRNTINLLKESDKPIKILRERLHKSLMTTRKISLRPTLHYRNRGQIFKIGVNYFKSRQGQKMPPAQTRHFLPCLYKFVY